MCSYSDVQSRNGLGSHAPKTEIGTVYGTIPCLPPNFQSKLDSIFISDVYCSMHRKRYGNVAIFQKLVEDLSDLRENGIELVIDGKQYKIYFITALIVGDNLGLNSIFGFVESFNSTMFCRMCYADPDLIKTLTIEDESLMRTTENYENGIKNINMTKTGIKSECVFNQLHDFHVIENATVDVMHDFFEGICSCVMAQC